MIKKTIEETIGIKCFGRKQIQIEKANAQSPLIERLFVSVSFQAKL